MTTTTYEYKPMTYDEAVEILGLDLIREQKGNPYTIQKRINDEYRSKNWQRLQAWCVVQRVAQFGK